MAFEVAQSDQKQRNVLFTGMELAMYMSTRLQTYLSVYIRLSSSDTTIHFRESLVNLWSQILGFIARAISIRRKRGVVRFAQALWGSDDLENFEEKCEKSCARAAEEARLCDSETEGQWREDLETRLMSLDRIHFIETGISKLQDKADLAKLVHAKEATYDSAAEGELPRCLPGTRTNLLSRITDWAADPSGKRIFWLCGKAGIGKSTVSRTIAAKLDEEGRLGASFYFKRGRADRSHTKLLFPTIALQLADKFPPLRHEIAAALENNSLLCEAQTSTQYKKLFEQPFQRLSQHSAILEDCFLVIDALDECDDLDQAKTVLGLFGTMEDTAATKIRILLTSRRHHEFVQCMGDELFEDSQLEDAQAEYIRSDIKVFLQHKLGVKAKNRNPFVSIPTDWINQASIDRLVEKSYPLFIVASTICRFLHDSEDPQRDLKMLLSQPHNQGLSASLSNIYLPILHQAMLTVSGPSNTRRLTTFKMIVQSLILQYDPLSITSLSKLLDMLPAEVGLVVLSLRSVLSFPEKADGVPELCVTVKLFHQSFRDFLLDPDLTELDNGKLFWIDENKAHADLAARCVRLLGGGVLKEDLCDVKAPGTRRKDVSKAKIEVYLPGEVVYACCYWVKHLVASKQASSDHEEIYQFLMKHLLHWMEALSWMGKASDVIHILKTLESAIDVSHMFACVALLRGKD